MVMAMATLVLSHLMVYQNFHPFFLLTWRLILRPVLYLYFVFQLQEIQLLFSNSENLYFNVNEVYVDSIRNGKSSKIVLQKAIEHHSKMCVENSGDVYDALSLVRELNDDVDYLIKRYSKCISKSTPNFLEWLTDEYKKRLRTYIRINFDEVKNLVH